MTISPYAQDMIDWCSQPPPQSASDTPAILCVLASPGSLPDRTLYRGFLFFKPGGTLMHGYFFGTLFLSQSKQVQREFARVVVAVRIPDGNLTLSASFLSSFCDVEPMTPEEQRVEWRNEPHNLADFEGLNVTSHGPTEYGLRHFQMWLENGWTLAYALRTVTPIGVTKYGETP